MKKISMIMLAVVALFATSCKDYLDVNVNQNKPTSVTADLILPQALVATGLVLNQYNTYGAQVGGYMANAGGYGGFNEQTTYAFTPNNYANLWAVSYDNLEDYQYMMDQTDGDPNFIFYNAVARIMKSYGFQLLVDAYNNVPYSQALLAAGNLTPEYDDAATIYASLASEIDKAIADLNTGISASVAPKALGTNDVVFLGNTNLWIRFANSVKLRLLIRGQGKVTFTNTSFDPAGFLNLDALINPGFARDNNRQNPEWNQWTWTYAGTAQPKAWIPTTFIAAFYNNIKINDPGRGKKMYYQWPTTGTNQLGFESTGIPKSPDGSFWYPGTERGGTAAGNSTGAIKGPDAGFVLMLRAESDFLLSEAFLSGIPTGASGDAQSWFTQGIKDAFYYTYSLPGGGLKKTTSTEDLKIVSGGDPTGDANAYITANAANALVDWTAAATNAQKLEAIITQKYIAVNMVNSQEGYNEYRRTGYPTITGTDPTFASTVSISSRQDRLPGRILYPTSEIQYNPANVPPGINTNNGVIFWAK
ncbi:MAG: SusD/RagB family nutrient-binding outer membrane lipoprotein [Bacteroidota bacterium]